ncbi:hypothetical protein PG987_010780 [Apiospora arundinis]|uniref:Uncharacterized protein n=1 Tax=Apiospora arundinis TaxID=335852 RepID=A0ABR2IRQ7_9PEZI
MLTAHRSSANTNDAVYDSRSCQEATFSGTRPSGSRHSGHYKSSESSGKTKHKSKKGTNSSKTDAERKQQQEKDLTGVGSQFDNNGDRQYAINDDDLYDDDISHSPSCVNGS